MTNPSPADDRRWCKPDTESDTIQIDPEFEGLIPPPSCGELTALHLSLDSEGFRDRDALVVWKSQGILVDGHNRIKYCREKGIPFLVVEMEFADREAAKEYIIQEQLGRRNLSAVAESYLRGKRYNAEKKSHGGVRRGAGSSAHGAPLKTDEALAAVYKVDPATIRRDGKFAEAVDAIVSRCGEEARHLILSRDSGLTRGGVHSLAKLDAAAQQEFLQKLADNKKAPRKPRKENGSNMTVPTEVTALARTLLEKLGAQAIPALFRSLIEALRNQRAESKGGENGVSAGEGNESAAVSVKGRRGGRRKKGSGDSGTEAAGAA